MKVPLSWLKQFVPITQTPDEIAVCLTRLGIEVESIQNHHVSFSHVVTAKVTSCARHPHADRLQIATVTDGSSHYQVVCGAANCKEGLIVALAKVGATLQDKEGKNWTIKKSKIRQIESEGMLCSKEELGLAQESDGIAELSPNTPLGIAVENILLDPVFDLSLTPNLGHVNSVLGVAKELAALLQIPLTLPKIPFSVTQEQKLGVQIEIPLDAPRFACCIIDNVTVTSSPAWLQERLKLCGIAPVNNIVDALHYITLELGLPFHAYDRHLIDSDQLIVKKNPQALSFTTLDGITRQIPEQTIMVYDHQKPLIIAGILGGSSSAISSQTSCVVIESAAFSAAAMRKTSKALGIKTDASYRFDRGIDIEMIPYALQKACQLVAELSHGQCGPVCDTYPHPLPQKLVTCSLQYIQNLLGLNLAMTEASDLLRRLEFIVQEQNDTILQVGVPSSRNDITCEADIAEEIARLYGYHNFPVKPSYYSAGSLMDCPLATIEKQIRHFLVQEGLQECMTCDLISPLEDHLADEIAFQEMSSLNVLHPRSADQSVLRRTLLPGLLKVAKHNFNHQIENLALFELGKVHYKNQENLFEPSCAAILLSGLCMPQHFDHPHREFDFFDLKGILENLLKSMHIGAFTIQKSSLKALHPGRQAQIKVQDEIVGTLGQIHPDLALKMGIKKKILFAELNVNDLLQVKKLPVTYQPLPAYPSTTRDWTVTVNYASSYNDIICAIDEFKPSYLESFTLIDSFPTPNHPEASNMTLRFTYRQLHQTTSATEVDAAHMQLTHSVAKKLADPL